MTAMLAYHTGAFLGGESFGDSDELGVVAVRASLVRTVSH